MPFAGSALVKELHQGIAFIIRTIGRNFRLRNVLSDFFFQKIWFTFTGDGQTRAPELYSRPNRISSILSYIYSLKSSKI